MRTGRSLQEIAREVKRKGYFDPADFPGLSLTLHELRTLSQLVQRSGISLGSEGTTRDEELPRREALQIINSLRKGVPPPLDVTVFSVGRSHLLGTLHKDLQSVESGTSQVRFMNADWGAGKTHSLYLLREAAFKRGFVVSIVSLSQSSCPLYDFMTVYHQVMWNLRTREERKSPALENVLDRWLQEIGVIGHEGVARILKLLPEHIILALQAYHESVSPVRRDEEKRMLVLDYLSGRRVYQKDLKRIGIDKQIDTSNALEMLGHMAFLFKNLKYGGVCILFDEAESIHSFGRSGQRDAAYNNIFQITQQSRRTPFCYFLYSTTPTFFDTYAPYWPAKKISSSDILELERLKPNDLQELASNICNIYGAAKATKVAESTRQLLVQATSDSSFSDTVGNFVRRCVAILDEGQ